MKLTTEGIAVIEGDRNASRQVSNLGHLEYDRTVRRILPLIEEGDTVIDVGALIGGFSFRFKEKVGSTGIVHAFEPNGQAFECLKHNCPGVVCHNLGLSNETKTLHFCRDSCNAGASYLDSGSGEMVNVVPLDHFFHSGGFRWQRLKVIKIDVEGMEPEVLAGAEKIIRTFKPYLFTEVNHGALRRQHHTWKDIVRLPLSLGYDISFVEPDHCLDEHRWPQVDIFFVPPKT